MEHLNKKLEFLGNKIKQLKTNANDPVSHLYEETSEVKNFIDLSAETVCSSFELESDTEKVNKP